MMAKSASVESVEIKVGKRAPFRLRLKDVPLEVRPKSEGTAELRVKGPLLFTVPAHPTKDLDIRVAQKITLLAGRLTLAKGVALKVSSVVAATAKIESPFAELTFKAPAAIPCRVLTMANSSSASFELHDFDLSREDTDKYARSEALIPLHSTARARAPFFVRMSVPMMVRKRKPGWLYLQATWGGGSLQGWVPEDKVTVSSDVGPVPGRAGVVPGICLGGPEPLVDLTVRKNAQVATKPGGAVWARTTKEIVIKAFAILRPDGWVQIASIKGVAPSLCTQAQRVVESCRCSHEHMWVRVPDVLLAQPGSD